ncbi:cell division protein FtsQ/DivIB [Marinivivus vitaminiproducens]|uniref:cell division protein FtsQ/DivIB n=1 Tax=Marinivivus vitaminiproducens TaxID=3035935 RepID=UPI00279CBF78|nr:FtsQ-type POTRA domain-containing protein [Geminicoccaceae bacterium SCSIO 64248]
MATVSTADPARRRARVQRQKPRPTWFKPAMVAGGASTAVLALAGTFALAAHFGWFDHAGERIRSALIDLSARSGLIVRNVYSEGREATRRADLLRAIGVEVGDPILAVDPEAIKRRVEGLAWVERADVVRLWPDTVVVRLSERRPIGLWQRPDRHVLIDSLGREIEGGIPQGMESLLILVGDGAPEHARALLALLSTDADLMRQIRAATWVGGRRWDLLLKNGMTVRFPEGDDARAWARLVRYVREERLLEKAVVAVDLRQADRTVVRLAPEAVDPEKAGGGA